MNREIIFFGILLYIAFHVQSAAIDQFDDISNALDGDFDEIRREKRLDKVNIVRDLSVFHCTL